MNDTKQGIGKCHSCQTLCVMHMCSCIHIASERSRQIIKYHLDRLNCQRIRICTVQCRYISLDRMCQRIHTCICNLFCRKSLYQFGIYDRNIRCDIKISQRIFYAGLIVCDNRKCCYFCCSTGCRRDRTEFCFLS